MRPTATPPPRGAHYRFQISSSSGGSRNRILLAVAERALARTDGRSRSTVIVSGVSPGRAATAASRRCGGWAETGLGQPWSSWPSAREAGPSRPTGVRVDERTVDVEVDTVKACRHGGSFRIAQVALLRRLLLTPRPDRARTAGPVKLRRHARQAGQSGADDPHPGTPVLPTGLITPSKSTRRSSRRTAAPGSVAQCRVPSD
jgi:hypothetical protein